MDELFGKYLDKFVVFNCRVEFCTDPKTGRCAVCSPWEAHALLGSVYEVLCVFAHGVGVEMGYIAVAGTTTGELERKYVPSEQLSPFAPRLLLQQVWFP